MSSMWSEDDVLEERAQSTALQEGLLLVAFTLVAIAVAIALHLHLGWPLWHAIVVGTCLYLAVLAAHALVRRSHAIRQLEQEIDALEGEIEDLRLMRQQGATEALASRQPGPPPPPGAAGRGAEPILGGPTSQDAPKSGSATPPPPPRLRSEAKGGAAPETVSGTVKASVSGPGSSVAKSREPSLVAGPQLGQTYESDSTGQLPPSPTLGAPTARPSKSAPVHELPGSRRTGSDGELDKIDDLIRKLAVDLGSVAPLRGPGTNLDGVTGRGAELPTSAQKEPEKRAPSPPPHIASPAADTKAGSVKSADAGMTKVAPGMRSAPVSRPIDRPADVVAAAIRNGDIDLFIEPIMGLDELKTRYFSISVCLRASDGSSLARDAYLSHAHDQRLMARLDVGSVKRAATVVQHIVGQGRETALLAKLASVSLTDEDFLDTFADLMDTNPDLAKSLIFSLAQGEVRRLSKAQWETLETMSEMGVRLVVDELTDLEMDFETLRDRGCKLVRLDAQHFVEGMRAGSHVIPPKDVCKYLGNIGFELIVDHIDDERTLSHVRELGAVLGQGLIFGGPKRVKSDIQKKADPVG